MSVGMFSWAKCSGWCTGDGAVAPHQAKRKRLSAQSYSKNGRSPNGNDPARR
jgi:hypothetical protein